MKAAVLVSPGKIEIWEHPVPGYKDDEVLVHIDCVGICGSDLHFFKDFHLGVAKITGTRILGHEVCGTVVQTGANVKSLKVGDKVVLDPIRSCGECEHCRTGRENLCSEGSPKYLGNAYTDGTLQEYFASPASKAYLLPKDCPPERACLLEPFSVALHAVKRSRPQLGDTAAVLGAGSIGLMTVLALKAHGIRDIIVVDLVKSRLDKALELGATHVINGKNTDTVEEVLKLTDGKGVSKVFETAGSQVTQAQSVQLLKKGGTIVMVGMSSAESVKLDLNTLLRKEGDIMTVFRFTTELKTAAEYVGKHGISLEKIITHSYTLDESQRAFEESIELRDQVIKAVIRI